MDESKLQEITEHWRDRIVSNIQTINQIRLDLLKLADIADDAELLEIAKRLNLARCKLANTITLRMLLNGANVEIISDEDRAECREVEADQ